MSKVKCYEFRGVRDAVVAEILEDTAEKFETGAPFSVAWISELSKETETSSENHYYDNQPAVTIRGDGADTVTAACSAIPFDVLAKLTGQYYDEETGMFVEGETETKYFAFGYITENTDGEEVFVWREKGTFSIPAETHVTKNDGTDANGQELTYTGIATVHKFEKTGKVAKAVNVLKSLCPLSETEFFATVQTPDTVKVTA